MYNAGIDEEDIVAIVGDVHDLSAPHLRISQLRVRTDGLFLRHPSMKENDGKRHRYSVSIPQLMLNGFSSELSKSCPTQFTYVSVLPILRTLEEIRPSASGSGASHNDVRSAVLDGNDDIDTQSSDESSIITCDDDDTTSIISISDESSGSERETDKIVIDLTVSDSE